MSETKQKTNGAFQEGGNLGDFSITVNAQYTKDLSFENPQAPYSLAGQTEQPEVGIQVDVGASTIGENTYEVVLKIKSEAKSEDKTVFLVDLSYGGVFTITVPEPSILEPLLFIECPRILFPFARNIVAEVVRDGGYPPLMINPFDFASMFESSREQQKQKESSQATIQ
jgi:preprotein translocase subunit SecB